jgi:hypothetical protein
MTTPNFAWPYPVRADPADMSDDLHQLALAVEATLQNIEAEITAQKTRYNSRHVYFARRVAALSITNAAWNLVPMDTVEIDTLGSPRPTGYYLAAGGASWVTVGGEAGERITGLFVNTAVVSQSGSPPPLASQVHPIVHNVAARVVFLNPADTITLRVWQSSGAALALNMAAGYQAHLTIVHLSGSWT